MRQKAMSGNTTTIPLPDQLYWKPTLCYGDPPHLLNANYKEAFQLHGEGGLVLHPNALPHHPAPVAEEVHK